MPVLKLSYTFDKLNPIQSTQNENLQKSFLDSICLPTSNINYQINKEKFNYQRIDSSYESVASSLKENLHKDIYKQIASQILVLHFIDSSYVGKETNEKIYKYMEEMTKNNGINPGLYAYGLLKIGSFYSGIGICSMYKKYITISDDYLEKRKTQIDEVKHNFTNPRDDKVIKILLGVMERDLNRDIQFVDHLKSRFEILCK
ncbi:hypothetical protein GCM10007390_18550 [Persicitalea jodogahamensis]|uniref:Uncharacterized protein n=2 Tax=Persicitalea jodogahamensis TaxID=402147 RepID=A0A8J3D300_9BACT|nr:hypothetical protein GCM10007390_18550 [Persicitalea jodogahamensis]